MKKLSLLTLFIFSCFYMLSAQEDFGQDPLYSAVIRANVEGVKQALADGADINRRSGNGYTPLMWACTYSSRPAYAEVAKLLLSEGADVNISTHEGITALMEAAENSEDVFELVLAKGADIKAMKNNGTGVFTSCIFGILMGNVTIELAEFILSKGMDVNEAASIGDALGWTPLHFAVSNSHEELVEMLVEKGANVNAATKDGLTPLSLAESNEYTDICEVLKDAGAR